MALYTIVVSGSRDKKYDKDDFYRNQIFAELDKLHAVTPIGYVAEGGQTGIDQVVRTWRHLRQIDGDTFYADWSNYGPAAGPLRNKRMLDAIKPDVIVLFPGGLGTNSMRRLAETNGFKTIEISLKDQESPNYNLSIINPQT